MRIIYFRVYNNGTYVHLFSVNITLVSGRKEGLMVDVTKDGKNDGSIEL